VKTTVLLALVAVLSPMTGSAPQSGFPARRTLPASTASPKSKPAATDFGGAIPGSPKRWFDGLDYPEIRYLPEAVSVAFDIDASGATKNCVAVEPISARRFGEKVCAALERNARFLPARSASGKPIATRARTRIRFENAD